MCKSCGKSKAKRFARFFLAAGRGFSTAQLRQRNPRKLIFGVSASSNVGARRNLNDTELQKNFRRKNTPRKSFLGHAQALDDLPIEAANGRPTPRCAAHRGEHACPRSAATGVSA
jgi:hypothetical protein